MILVEKKYLIVSNLGWGANNEITIEIECGLRMEFVYTSWFFFYGNARKRIFLLISDFHNEEVERSPSPVKFNQFQDWFKVTHLIQLWMKNSAADESRRTDKEMAPDCLLPKSPLTIWEVKEYDGLRRLFSNENVSEQ